VTHELIGEYPTADDREQMGRFLRHAFPLGLGLFAEFPSALRLEKTSSNPKRDESRDNND
jgi:hypothetical protein